jgi:Protein of unknown function (DUF3093)
VPTAARAAFDERRAVPWWWWAVALVLAVPSTEAVVVLGPEMSTEGSWALGAGCLVVTVSIVAAALIALSRSRVVVDDVGLRADRTVLPAASIGRVRVLDRAATRTVLGRDARADAHLTIRPWIHTAVQIDVSDGTDRTPYWVVGTRHPDELARALRVLAADVAGDDVRDDPTRATPVGE